MIVARDYDGSASMKSGTRCGVCSFPIYGNPVLRMPFSLLCESATQDLVDFSLKIRNVSLIKLF